ncbi:MAG: 3-oxoacyl-ACP reductase FabG [Clostridia bacterium]
MKTVLITGASKGIGRQMAIAFAKERYNVIINYNKSQDTAKALESELKASGYSVVAIKADISSEEEVQKMIYEGYSLFSSIDVLINNAAISSIKLFTDITLEEWNEIFSVNVNGTFNVTKAVLNKMINAKYGKIINVSSIWGMVGASCETHYSATKGAIISLTKALAKELGPSNINVNCIAPGVIATEMNDNLTVEELDMLKEDTPLERIGSTTDIANLALFLASDKASFITGQIISPNGGFVI